MSVKTILVTGIGGNVGQGILRCIRDKYPEIRLVGTNIEFFTAGSHLVDKVFQVPFAYEKQYLDSIAEIVENEKINLIIPSTDYEVFHLSEFHKYSGIRSAISPQETSRIYLDKLLSWEHHHAYEIPMAECCLPSEFRNQFDRWIVKPRKGRGSRGLHFCPKDCAQFNDKDFLVQELIQGTEVTTSFYIDLKGELHGHITLERELSEGTTSKCRVATELQKDAEVLIRKLIKHTKFIGSANIQSILRSDGALIPFEINCRISGTNSIRHRFGFQDVVYTVEEHLFGESPTPVVHKKGVAVRILMDVIYLDRGQYPETNEDGARHFLS